MPCLILRGYNQSPMNVAFQNDGIDVVACRRRTQHIEGTLNVRHVCGSQVKVAVLVLMLEGPL